MQTRSCVRGEFVVSNLESFQLKILMMFHFCPNSPPRDLGPAKRMHPLLVETLKRHDVSVLSFGSSEEEQNFKKEFDGACSRIIFVNNVRPRFVNLLRRSLAWLRGKASFHALHSRRMQQELDNLLNKNEFDLIFCSTPILGSYRFPTGIPLVADTHNVEFDLAYRSFLQSNSMLSKIFYYLDYRLGKPLEIRYCMKFDEIIATTVRDLDVFRSFLPNQEIKVIQNGVDRSFLEPMDVEPEPGAMAFTGMMSYFPNIHGILQFLDATFPHVLREVPMARLYIVGKNPPGALKIRASDNVVITGFVDDVRPYIARCEVFIIPLLIGGHPGKGP